MRESLRRKPANATISVFNAPTSASVPSVTLPVGGAGFSIFGIAIGNGVIPPVPTPSPSTTVRDRHVDVAQRATRHHRLAEGQYLVGQHLPNGRTDDGQCPINRRLRPRRRGGRPHIMQASTVFTTPSCCRRSTDRGNRIARRCFVDERSVAPWRSSDIGRGPLRIPGA